jgi:fructokinase
MIVVIGEALIDLIQDRTKTDSYTAVVGGANANVAIALARRGVRQQLLARISTDSFGQKIRKRLMDNHVGLDYAITAKEQSTLAVASVDDEGVANYSFYVKETADWGFTPEELLTDIDLENMHAKAIQYGCLTMAMAPGNEVIERWIRAHYVQSSLTLSHDINIRPALGFEASKEKARVEAVNSMSHIIKASDDDINWLYSLKDDANIDEIVWGWIGESDKIVFVTRGADGVSVYRKNKTRFDVASRKVQVADTVGAGDTFCANLLAQLLDIGALGEDPYDLLANLKNEDLKEIVRIAGVAASIACERVGAEPPTLAELNMVLSA